MPSKLETEFIDRRFEHIEEKLDDHGVKLARVEGTLDVIKDSLNGLAKSTNSSDWTKKALLGAIVVQSLLYGITDPSTAKTAISALLHGIGN